MRLKVELNLLIGIAAAVALGGLGVLGGLRLRDFWRVEAVEARGRAMVRVLSPTCARALERARPAELEPLVADLKRWREAPDQAPLELVSLAVIDERGEPAVEVGIEARGIARNPLVQRARLLSPGEIAVEYPQDRWGPLGEAVVVLATPLRTDDTPRGVLWCELSLSGAQPIFWRAFLGLFAAGTLGAVAVWFLAYKLIKTRILAPILELSRGIERVRSGDLTARVTLEREDEIGTLVASFNDMVTMLRERPALEQKVDEAERLELSHRRLAQAHKELAEAHAALQETKDRLVFIEKQAVLARLVRSVAHELKNPLNSAQNALPSLEAASQRIASGESSRDPRELEEDRADVASSLGVLRRSVARAVSIIHDLQGFAQLGAADLAPVELRRVIEDAGLSCQPVFGDRIRLEVDVGDDNGKPIQLKAFPTLLGQTFVNLFTNAAEAIQGNGTIHVTARMRGDQVRIEVQDSGPGIPPEHMAKLFEPFFTTKGVAGTGLGLALSFAYVERHGGTIEARSEPGRGATFTIEIPREARVEGPLGPRASALFDVPRDSVAAAARARRGG